MTGGGGWCAPEQMTCTCGAVLESAWPGTVRAVHRCPLPIVDTTMELPTVSARRGGLRFGPRPAGPTLHIQRIPGTARRMRRWVWTGYVPGAATGGLTAAPSGIARFYRLARRRGLGAIAQHTSRPAQITVKR
jgi:hypothetical protein